VDWGQLLGIWDDNRFYRFELEAFTLKQPQHWDNNRSGEHRHDVYHLALFLGDNVMLHNGKKIKMQAGTLFLSSPGEPHCFTALVYPPVHYHEITFRLRHGEDSLRKPFTELLTAYFELPGLIPTCLKNLSLPAFEKMQQCYINASNKIEKHRLNPRLASVEIVQLLFTCARLLQNSDADEHNGAHKLQRALEYLSNASATGINLSYAAELVEMSKEHFCRKFKAQYGITPIAYWHNSRMQSAAQMIKYSELPIKEIASKFGFLDVYHFSKAFKTHFAIPPGEYRKM
jgi:AraC-like DNA-binding protein